MVKSSVQMNGQELTGWSAVAAIIALMFFYMAALFLTFGVWAIGFVAFVRWLVGA